MGRAPMLWPPFLPRPLHKRKGGQVRFSNEQTVELEKKFDSQKYMSPSERKKLAKSLRLSERQVGNLLQLVCLLFNFKFEFWLSALGPKNF